ncbi:snRNA-activating protein complex (SNAPc), subunit 3 [Popillia japonica]|uniref:snRNA-activating protein complex (SNAPc), subunit 3 n=1 Tax=Popillia japonica TaxID=7064 RepID=A0AAW1IVL6_POPJA
MYSPADWVVWVGLEIVPNGITLLTDYSGRSSGEAYVQFVSKEVAEKALQKHREKIGHRYIEIFRSYSNRRMGGSGGGSIGGYSRPGPYDRGDRYGGGGGGSGRFHSRGSRSFKGGYSNNMPDYNDYDNRPWISNHNGDMRGGGNRSPFDLKDWGSGGSNDRDNSAHCVHMRGLPFKATQMDIAEFFKPIIPMNIRLLQDHTGRASGEADVEFASHDDAVRAMSKDKGHMQHRYIEFIYKHVFYCKLNPHIIQFFICNSYVDHNTGVVEAEYPSALIGIDDTLYVDMRSPNAIDYSEVIQQWASQKKLHKFKTVRMDQDHIYNIRILSKLLMSDVSCKLETTLNKTFGVFVRRVSIVDAGASGLGRSISVSGSFAIAVPVSKIPP